MHYAGRYCYFFIVQLLTVDRGKRSIKKENKLFKYQLHIQNVEHAVKHFIYVIKLFFVKLQTNVEGVHLSVTINMCTLTWN